MREYLAKNRPEVSNISTFYIHAWLSGHDLRRDRRALHQGQQAADAAEHEGGARSRSRTGTPAASSACRSICSAPPDPDRPHLPATTSTKKTMEPARRLDQGVMPAASRAACARRRSAIENIEVVYNHSVQALRGLSIEVPAGEIVALLGSNGAGKTTTLKAASGILPLENGRVASRQHPLLRRRHRRPAAAPAGARRAWRTCARAGTSSRT